MDPQTTIISEVNKLAKPTDYKSLYLVAQQAFENGFRGLTITDLVVFLSNNLPEELVRSEFIYTEANPSLPLTNPGRKVSMFAPSGTYTTPSGILNLEKDFNVIGWDGEKWAKLVEMELPQADNKLKIWVPEVVQENEQRIDEGELFRAKEISSESPGISPDKWEKVLKFWKAIESPVDGFGDENQNLVNWIDKLGFTHLALHPDSYPEGLKTMAVESNDYWDWAISDGDYIIQGQTKNGIIYPEVSISDNGDTTHVPVILSTLEKLTQPNNITKDGIYNQWIRPWAVVDLNRDLWFSSIGSKGNIYINKMCRDGRTIRIKLGDILSNLGSLSSDDHNAPSILLDERPGAEYPILIAQCDHNTTPMRYWRFSTLDPTEWDVSTYQTIGVANVAYSQIFRHNDEIFIFCRRPALPRPWRLIYSPNNGDTWQSRDLFSTDATWLYMLFTEKEDKSGINIAVHGHPQNSTDQSIYIMQMDYETGSIMNPASSIPIISNIRTAVADIGFVPVDPFAMGLKVYQATGTQSTRLWDVSKESDGYIAIAFNISPSKERTMTNFNASRYYVVRASLDDGTVDAPIELEIAGVPTELVDRGESMYFAGVALVNNYQAVICTWRNISQINGGDNISDDTGKTTGLFIDFSNASSLIKNQLFESDLKVIRPYLAEGYLITCECEKYLTYGNFYANILVNELEILNK